MVLMYEETRQHFWCMNCDHYLGVYQQGETVPGECPACGLLINWQNYNRVSKAYFSLRQDTKRVG